MNDLKNKVAFITGGSRGMGAALAKRLAADGADIVFTYSQSSDKAQMVKADIEKLGRKVMALQADNQKPKSLELALESAAKEFGSVDILVNNAGIYMSKPFEEFSLDEFDQIVNINVRAVFIASQTVLQYMPDGGRIITMGSNLAERVVHVGNSLYSMSKSALIGLTKGMARELGARKITVNLLQPGSTDTDMNPAHGEHANGQRMLMAIPQFGSVEDIAGVVSLLAGEGGRFISGASITIDGGANI
jgi:3-oxoacyl-[acyl-carrier protein] reductase